jgi:hypothetical protein
MVVTIGMNTIVANYMPKRIRLSAIIYRNNEKQETNE